MCMWRQEIEPLSLLQRGNSYNAWWRYFTWRAEAVEIYIFRIGAWHWGCVYSYLMVVQVRRNDPLKERRKSATKFTEKNLNVLAVNQQEVTSNKFVGWDMEVLFYLSIGETTWRARQPAGQLDYGFPSRSSQYWDCSCWCKVASICDGYSFSLKDIQKVTQEFRRESWSRSTVSPGRTIWSPESHFCFVFLGFAVLLQQHSCFKEVI